jgi:hypothetical protein
MSADVQQAVLAAVGSADPEPAPAGAISVLILPLWNNVKLLEQTRVPVPPAGKVAVADSY